MADSPVRWAIVGVGIAGFARSKAIAHDPRSVLAAVWRGRKADETGAPRVARFEEAVQAADAVAVCSPTPAHPEQVLAALQAGRHVVCEFPLAPDAATAASLFALARARQRVLHVEHIELLTGTASVLRANVRPLLVRRVDVGFRGGGPEEAPGAELALRNVARLHRLVDVAGPVVEVLEVHHAHGRLEALLRLDSGGEAHLLFEQSPLFRRTTRLKVHDGEWTWRQENQALWRDRTQQTLVESAPLFDQDHAAAMARILGDRREDYVREETILHVLRVVQALRDGRTGPVSG